MKKILFVVFLSAIGLLTSMDAMAFEAGQTVRIVYAGKSLLVNNSSLDVNKPVFLWTETNTNSQRWVLEDAGKGAFYLRNAYTDFYLGTTGNASNGAQLGQIASSRRANYGMWTFEPMEEDGEYVIYMGTSKNLALGIPTSTADSTQINLQTYSKVLENKSRWKVEVVEGRPNKFTEEIRDDMMEKWKARHYHKAGTGHVIDGGGFWGDAEMFEVILDALETTGDPQYATMFDELYKNFCQRQNTDWSWNDYNDDIAWMIIACVRAYLLTGDEDYRQKAKSNFDMMYSRADVFGNGTLVWNQKNYKNGDMGTNSCINGPATVAACYLAEATGNMSYYDKAARTYAGERATMYEFSNGKFTGKVYDSYNNGEKRVANDWSSTYNQGTCLGSAILLYKHFGSSMYKSDADAIMRWTASNMTDSHSIIKACQTARGDLANFKGILMRYVRLYAAELNHPEYYDWMAKNALHAWNNRNSAGISMSGWLTKTPENFYYKDGGDFSNSGEGACTALSAAFNAHLGVVSKRDAYEIMQAESFNYRRYVTLGDSNDEDGTASMGPFMSGEYVGYKNVNFGNKLASHLKVRIKSYTLTETSRISFYADDPKSGILLGTVKLSQLSSRNKWQTLEVELTTPLSGVHDIYIVASGSSGRELATVNWFTFDARNTVYSDLTNNSGKLTSSAHVDLLNQIADDSPLTDIYLPLQPEGENWIQYDSPAPIQLGGYSVFAANASQNDPAGWILQGSNDGEEWTTIDTQDDVTFTARSQRIMRSVETETAYSKFRLAFTSNDSISLGDAVTLSEWQLLGKSVSTIDITADGGTIDAGMEALIDKDNDTPIALTLPLNVVYQSTGNNLVNAYTLTALSTDKAPSAWEIYGSNDGKSWTLIDKQEGQTFPFDNSTVAYMLKDNTAYANYRLNLLGEGEVEISEWQLFGRLDFGTFYPDLTNFATPVASDGSETSGLNDDNGDTYASLSGEDMRWSFEFPMDVRVLGYSIVSADDPDLNPKNVAILGMADGEETSLSARTMSFTARGSRVTNTLSTSKEFRQIDFQVRTTVGGGTETRVAELEIYATALAEEGSSLLPEVDSVTTTAPGVSASEGIEKLTDQVRTTRYRADFTEPISLTFNYATPQVIDTYGITTAKDEPTRDPKTWQLLGSNDDGETWDVLDERSDESFAVRYVTQFYSVPAPQAYKTYCLRIIENGGDAQLQLCQLQMLNLGTPTGIARISKATEGLLTFERGDLVVDAPQATTLRIYDVQGRMVQTQPVEAGRSTVSMQLPAGIYVVAMKVNNRNVWLKIAR